ncbi:Long-chain-fatty-acid--CoA ligase FadD15 [Bacteroidales bacterium Barb6XT]|nr:Long-chain-fatty-acid--CoA ligase FadD15 [Bacteroidales bacterium Barb6XT]OAV69114.1 Long-chain-fatty-acid--CoA ligase FadD15 [Bacteroidales bacterium Barb6XT]
MEPRFLPLIEQSIKTHWHLPALTDYAAPTLLYSDFAREIAKLHILLDSAGIQKGDKVALVGRNSAAWAITFFGTLSYGAVIVPILHDFTPDSIARIIVHSESKALFITAPLWHAIDENLLPSLYLVSLLDNKNEAPDLDQLFRFKRKYPNGLTPADIHYHIEDPQALAVLNYTSGTTSSPKGVMIPYRSLWSNTQFAADRLPFIHPADNIICMLPMAHMYGLAFEILNSINKGCHIHFLARTPSPAILAQAFADIRPALILAVPLILEKIVTNKILPRLQAFPLKYLLKLPLVDRLVFRFVTRKLAAVFGGKCSEVVIGGAALSKDVAAFLTRIRFPYTVGYGMTECGPLVAYEQWDTFKAGSVGRIVDRMEVLIDSPDPRNQAGEILVRGDNLMLGYYKNPEATQAVMQPDGWMRTGDLGTIDADGFLYIRGRCKSLILSSNGQNIYPEEIEEKLNEMPYIAESIVISDNSKITALICLDRTQLDKDGISSSAIDSIMQDTIAQLNMEIPAYSKVHNFKIHTGEFEKTPKRSIKRYLYQSASEEPPLLT